jgi:prepilin-type N-terminal cleavage/methylation domain-containing protein
MKSRGLTLIEVMVSIFIVAFILVGMMRLYSLGSIQLEIARHKMMAINLAQAEIENLRNSSYEGITLSNYPITQTVKIDTGRTSSINDDINGAMVTDISPISEGYKIVVSVSWTDYYGAMGEVLESTLTSYI